MNLPKTGILIRWGKDKVLISWWFSTYIHANGKEEPSIVGIEDISNLPYNVKQLCFKKYTL